MIVCPVCRGRGKLPIGFYSNNQNINITSCDGETCKSCNGTGMVLEYMATHCNSEFNTNFTFCNKKKLLTEVFIKLNDLSSEDFIKWITKEINE